MRIVTISDTHSLHHMVPSVPDGDVLVFAGDLMNSGWDWRDISSFDKWLGTLPHKFKVVVAGNHDWLFERNPTASFALLTNATHYLENDGTVIDGFRFWGSPQQPEFMNWAFNVPRGAAIKRYWDLIPDDTDVLITHGPPYGIQDKVAWNGRPLGCEELRFAVQRVRPQLHIFGHIHGGAGVYKEPFTGTTFVNTSFLNEDYAPWALPINVFDLEAPRG